MSMQLIPHQDSPRYIRLHPADNVGVVVNEQGVAKGGRFADGLVAVEGIPQSHKVALQDIAVGGDVVRYGEVIVDRIKRDAKEHAMSLNQYLLWRLAW